MPLNTFISCAASDSAIAHQIGEVLDELGVSYFHDQRDISFGEAISDNVQNALVSSSNVLIVVSPASVKSNWLPFEVGKALALGKTVLPYLTHPALELPSYLSNFRCATTVDEIKAYFRKVVADAQEQRQCFLIRYETRPSQNMIGARGHR